MSSPELDFVSRFLTLATLSKPELPADYKLPLQQVSSQGIALPPVKYKYDPRRSRNGGSSEDDRNSSVILTLKSVRAPKFSVEWQFSTRDTVLQVKERLVEEGKASGTQNLKLLLKGKVLHDSELLSSVTSDRAIINVMISKVAQTAASPALEHPEVGSKSPLSEMPWNEIENILSSKFADPRDAQEALDRLKRGWELAK
ncbi:hypothetical protein HG537_0E02170 [Torulaspora globosa]|uniref:Ubiquitin-like domain-containing protein n=1 Tax=Torulaspora globosa TaxID=48254 RepID=A0A7H9HWV5_9SACH|nr:hypothetical protein HG537_0E02170 [Torulaspora sp. CBS 2947]